MIVEIGVYLFFVLFISLNIFKARGESSGKEYHFLSSLRLWPTHAVFSNQENIDLTVVSEWPENHS